MVDPLTPDDAEDVSGTKENFVGKVLGSSIEGLAESAKDEYKESGQSYESDVPRFDHFAHIKPLDGQYDKNQNIFGVSVREGRTTKWMVLMSHFYDIHGDEWTEAVESHEDIPEFITGRVYEFRDVSWTEDEEVPMLGVTYQEVGRGKEDINSMLVPTREVTDDTELADLGEDVAASADTSVEL